jgi:inosose dehydratase
MIKFGYAFVWNWVNPLGMDFHKALDEIALTGWDGVECSGFLAYYLEQVEELKKILKLHGLEMATFNSFLTLNNREVFGAELASIKAVLKLISQMDRDVFVMDGGMKLKGLKESDYKYSVENIKKICQLAYKENIKPTWHLHWGTMWDSPEHFEYLMEETKDSGLYFCPDTAQIFMIGMDPLEVMKKYRDRISHIHFKDAVENEFINRYLEPTRDVDPAENALVPLASAGTYRYHKDRYLDDGAFHINSRWRVIEVGRGEIDFKPIVKLIKEIGYKGWVVVDQDYTGYRSMESLDVNLNNLKYLFG